MLELMKKYSRYLLFGFVHTFFSGLGQTYLLAFFIVFFLEDFSCSNTEVGLLSMYMSLGSAFSLPYLGGLLDRVLLRPYSVFAASLLFCGCLVVSVSDNMYMLFLGLYLIRLSAHGLLPHIADVSISRYFKQNRGKALALSGMGASLGEAVLPLLVGGALLYMPWRSVYSLYALAVLCVFVPLIFLLVRKDDAFCLPPEKQGEDGEKESRISRRSLLRSSYFMSILTLALMPPFIITGVLFYQGELLRVKGWGVEVMAQFFVGFAIFRIASGLIAGYLVDRFSAKRLVPFSVLPLSLGILGLVFLDSSIAALVFYSLAGATLGLSNNFKAAVWSEVYGVRYIATIRSVVASAVVLSTALSPPIIGVLLDSDVSLLYIFGWGVVMIWAATVWHYLVARNHKQEVVS